MGSLKETKKLCEELYKHLDKHFEYGIVKDGKLKTHVSNKDIAKYYRFQSPDEFKQNGGGICFDYVEYEEAWLKENGVSCRKFYLITETPPDYDTHTFVVIETEGKFIWVESSMKNSQGVHIFSKLRDLLKMAAWGCFRGSRNKEHLNGVKYSVFEYTNNHPKYGCGIGEYMDWMIEHGKWVFDDMTKKEQPQIVEEAAAFSRRGVSGWKHTDATYEEKKNFERAMSFNSEIVYLRKEMNHMTKREIVQRLASLYNKLAEIYDNIEEDYTEVPMKTSRLGFARKPEKRSMSHRQYIDRLIYEIRDNVIELNRHFNRSGVKIVIQKMMDVWEYEKRELHINDHIGDKLVGNLTEKASHTILDKIMDSYVDKFYDNESADDVYQEEVQTPPDRTKLIQDYQKDVNKAVVDYQKLWEKTLMTLHQMKKVGGEPFQKMYDQLHDRRDQFIDDLKQTLPPGHLEKNKEPSWIKNIRTNTNMRFKLVKTAIDTFDSSPGMVKLVPLYQAFRMLFISMIEVCDFVPGVSIKVKLPYIPKINIHLASMTEPITSWDQVYQEAKLSTDDRNDLDDSQFGIPELRKYPLTDEKHVLQAVRFFNKAPDEYKEELAKNIVKRAKELGMDWENWESLKPYLDKKVQEAVDINSLRQQCQEVFQQASQIHYGCLDENGERITASPFKDSWKMISTYHSQSIQSMEQSKLGVCFEHSFYVAKLLKDRGLPCQTFFLNCNIDHTQPPEEDVETDIQQESESIAVEQHNNNDMSFWHQFTIVPNDTDSIVLIETSLTHEKNGVFLVENMDDVVSHLIQTFDLHLSQEDLQLMKQDLIDVSSFEPRDGDTYVGYINQVYLNGKFIKNEIRINHQTKTMKTYWQYLSDHKYLSDDGMKINEQIQQMDDNTAFDIINLLNATQLFTQEGLQFHQSFFGNDKIHMSVSEMESALKGFVQESYMGTNHNTLKEKYHYIPLTEQSVKKYKDQGVFKHGLRRVRVNDNTKGAIYIDENHIVVAYVAVEKKINGQRWITALEVSEEYQGHDYGVDLLQIAVDDFGATYLSVNKKNKRAFHMYKKYGWNVCDEDDHVFFMKLTERTDE